MSRYNDKTALEQAFESALVRLATGDVASCRKHLEPHQKQLSGIWGPKIRQLPWGLCLSDYRLPPMFVGLIGHSSNQDFRQTGVSPHDRPVVDIAGLLMLNRHRHEHKLTTPPTLITYRASDPLAVIKQARADPVIASIESTEPPLVSAPVCALLSDFDRINPKEIPGQSLDYFYASIQAGHEVGDPIMLAGAIFFPPIGKEDNRQRLEAVLPYLPSPLPAPIRDSLWYHALYADNAYANASPNQGGKSHSEPGFCQQLLIEKGIRIAASPHTPLFVEVIGQAFRVGASHLVDPMLEAQRQTPNSGVLLRIINNLAGQRYSITEQNRIIGMIEAFSFQPQDLPVLSCPLPNRKGNTVLHCMISDGNFALARKFIEMGASTSVLNKAKQTPLTCSKKRSKNMVRGMAEIAAMIPMQDKDRQFMLFKACRAHDVKLACQMMDEGADLFALPKRHNVISEMFMEVLKMSGAAHAKAQSSMKKIIDHHIDLHGPLTTEQANRLLLHAASSGSDAIVKVALEKGASHHALAEGLNNPITSLMRNHVQNFITIMTDLAWAGMDPDYRIKNGELLFEKIWHHSAFSHAVQAVESSQEMEKAVAHVNEDDPASSSARPRF